MATPKEQHEARRGRVTGTDWERRRELELARDRVPAHEADGPREEEVGAARVDGGEPVPSRTDAPSPSVTPPAP